MGGPDGPRPTHCSTGPPKTFLKKIKNKIIYIIYLIYCTVLFNAVE
jgi:hypothetical protein